MSRSIATKVTIEGEKQYTSALKNINSELQLLQSQMKTTTAQYQNNANSQEALNAKLKVLNESYVKQQEKINLLNEAIAKGRTAQEQWRAQIEKTNSALEAVKGKLSTLDSSVIKAGEQWNKYKTQLDAAKTELKALETSTEDTTEEQAELTAKISDLEQKMATLDTSTDGAASATGELLAEQSKLNTTLEKQQNGYQTVTNKVNKWGTQLNNAKTASYNLSTEITKTKQYLNEAKTSYDRCATSIDKFGNETEEAKNDLDAGNSSIEDMSQSFQALSSILAASKIADAVRAVADALKECVDTTADFTYTMATVEATSGATQEELNALETQAKEYASNSIFMAQDVADSYQVMAQAGWTAQDMLDGMSGVMNLSAASTEELGDVTNIVVDALTAFGYAASDAGRFADVLAEAAAASNTSVSLMGNSFTQVASTAGAMGYTIEDVASALAVMANNGIKGETAGAALSTALTRMAGGNETATNALNELNVSMMDSSGQARDLGDFLGDLRTAFSGLTDEEKINYAYQLAGQRGMKGLLAIVNTADDDWNAMADAIENCNGAAETMADIQLDTYTGQVQLLKSATEGLEIAVGEKLTPALGNLAEGATDVLNKATEVVGENDAVVSAVTAIATAVGTFTTAVTVGTAATAALKAGIALISTTIGPAVPIIAAAAAVLGTLAAALTYASSQGTAMESSIERLKDATQNLESSNSVAELANEYSSLRQQTEDTHLTEEQLASVEERLSQVRQDLAEATGNQAIAQGDANTVTDAAVEVEREIAEAEAERAKAEVYKALVDGAQAYQEELVRQEQLEAEAADAQERYTKAAANTGADLETVYSELESTVSALRDDIESGVINTDTTEGVDQLNEKLRALEETIFALTGDEVRFDGLADAEAYLDDMDLSLGNVANGLSDAAESAVDTAEALSESKKETDAFRDSVIQMYTDGLLTAEQASSLLGDSVDSVIKSIEEEQKAEEEAAKEAENLGEASADAADANGDLGDSAEGTGKQISEEDEAIQEATQSLAKVGEAAHEAIKNGGDLREAYEELTKEAENYTDEADAEIAALTDRALEMLNFAATVQELETAYGDLTSQIGISSEQIASWLIASGQSFDDFQSTVESAQSSIVNSFEKMDTSLDMSLSKMASNLQANITAQSEWSNNIAILWNAAVESGQAGATEFVQTLYEMGPEAASQVAQMVSDVDGTLSTFAPLFANAGAEAIDQAALSAAMASGSLYDATSSAAEGAATAYSEGGDWEGAGETQTSETASGVEAGTEDIVSSTESAADAAITAWNDQSSGFVTAGKNAGTSISNGISAQKSTIGAAAKDAAMSAHTSIATIGWYSLGKAIAQGVANGISANTYLIKSAATSAATAAYNAAKDTLDINSPSKVMMKVGLNYDAGFAGGIAKGTDEVVASVNAMTKASIPDVSDLRERASYTTNITNQYGSARDREIIALLQRYLPGIQAIENAVQDGSLSTVSLAAAITPYIDKNLGIGTKRKQRGN